MFDRLRDDELVRAPLERLATEIDGDVLQNDADPAQCFTNHAAQTLICLYQMSVWSALNEARISPATVAGYSIGELAAWGVAGALEPVAVLHSAATRAAAMDACAPRGAGMLALMAIRPAAIEGLVKEFGVMVAIRNGEDHVVLAGSAEVLDRIEALMQHSATHAVRLPVSVPAHSPWLSEAVPVFRSFLETLNWNMPAQPVLAGIDGQPRYRATDAIEVLSRQLAEPVEWAQALDIAVEMGATCFFELGPGDSLCRMLRKRHTGVYARALDDFASTSGAIDWLRRHSSH
jgi:[acyl-carrier-protein] S-malonyltransferase